MIPQDDPNGSSTSPSRAAQDDDRTRIYSPVLPGVGSAQPVVADDDRTVLAQAPPPPRNNDEKTIVAAQDDDKTRVFVPMPSAPPIAIEPARENIPPVRLQPVVKTTDPVDIGSRIKDRFILKERLGSGGMSVVFKALDLRKQEAKNSNPFVAIKVLGDLFADQMQSLLVLERESQQIQKLAHPNIVTVYDFDRDGDTIYMTMECLDGQSIGQVIAKHKQGMSYADVVPYVDGMCRGLEYAHSKQIIHSDFKPENIFYTKDNVVKILDFGIARAKRRPGDEVTEEFDAGSLGALTPQYASCEMFEKIDPDPRDDIYALGCITYKLLTGEHPFNGMSSIKARDKNLKPKRINPLTNRQWRTLEASLSFDREKRTRTVTDFLEGFLPSKRSPWIYATAAALILTVSVGGYSWFTVSTQPEAVHVELTDEQRRTITSSLETADVYISMGYLASPPGDSALDQYVNVLKIDPTNKVAIAGKKNIARKYLELAKEEVGRQNFEQSLALVKTGLSVEPDNIELKTLEREVASSKGQSK